MVLGKWDRYMQKNKTRPPSYATHKNEFKWIKDLNVTHETIKILEEKIGSKLSDVAYSNILSDISPQAGKQKKKQMELHQTKKVLYNKGNCQQNEKTTHSMEEDIHQRA